MIRLALAAALAGCWSAPAPPPGPRVATREPGLPGLVWQSPVQPFRHGHPSVDAIASDGEVLMIGTGRGATVTRLDLRTGRVTAERQLDPDHGILVDAIASLGDRRWLVIAQSATAQRVWTLDDSFVATPVELGNPDQAGGSDGEIAVLDDGVIIVGNGLPLAIYDKRTFALRETLDPGIGWHTITVDGRDVVATRQYRAIRFDRLTGAQTPVPSRAVSSGGKILTIERSGGETFLARYVGVGAPNVRFPEGIEEAFVGPGGTIVTTTKGGLQVRSLPDGTIAKRIALGPAAGDLVPRRLAWIDATHVAFELDNLVRTVDLGAGTISPAGDPPWGHANRVAIDDAGTVMVAGDRFAWQLANGRVVASVAYEPGEVHRTSHLDTVASVVLVKDKRVTERAFGKREPVRTWELAEEAYDAWFGRSRESAVFDVLSDDGPLTKAVIARGPTDVTDFIRFNPDGALWDVEVDTGEGLVVIAGTMGIAKDGVPGPHRMMVPSCAELSEGHLERRGRRALAVGETELAVYDRTTGALLGAAKFSAPITSTSWIPGRAELLVATRAQLGVWSPSGDLRAHELAHVAKIAVSPNGKRAAASFTDGHVAMFDVAALIALPLAKAPARANVPAACSSIDPFEEPVDRDFENCDGDDC